MSIVSSVLEFSTLSALSLSLFRFYVSLSFAFRVAHPKLSKRKKPCVSREKSALEKEMFPALKLKRGGSLSAALAAAASIPSSTSSFSSRGGGGGGGAGRRVLTALLSPPSSSPLSSISSSGGVANNNNNNNNNNDRNSRNNNNNNNSGSGSTIIARRGYRASFAREAWGKGSTLFIASPGREFYADDDDDFERRRFCRGRRFYATTNASASSSAKVSDDENSSSINGSGNEDNAVTVKSKNILVRPKSELDSNQGELEDKTVPVYASAHILENEEMSEKNSEKILLPGRHFDVPIRVDIAHRVVRWQLARKRGVSTAKTKSRAEVSGTTRKARPQKGGGRARVGSLRAPQMRGGGTAHGPIPRDFEHKLQKKVRRLGLRVALSAKAAEGRLVVVEDLKWMSPNGKTKEAKYGLEKLLRYDPTGGEEGWENMRLSPSPLLIGGTGDSGNKTNTKFSALIVGDRLETTDESDDGWLLHRGTRNIENIHVMPQVGLNVYSILKHRCLVMTKKAVEELVERLDKPIKR